MLRPRIEKLGDLMRVGEAAEFIGVSIGTLRNWDRAGKVKALRHPINGYRLYRRKELRELMTRLQRA